MRALLLIGLAISGCHGCLAQDKTMEELHLLNNQFILNFMHNDTVAHNQIIHPGNFLFIDSNGLVVDRAGYMKKCANGYDAALLRDYRYTDENIRVFGNTAIITAKTVCMANKGNYWAEEKTRYSDTYIKEHGRWWCIQSQLTKINM